MKKKFFLFIFLTIIINLNTTVVNAADLKCHYVVTGQQVNFNVTLAYDNPTQPSFAFVNKSKLYGEVFDNFKQADFNTNESSGIKQCPALYYSQTMQGKNRYSVSIESNPKSTKKNKVTATSASGFIDKATSKGESITCYYSVSATDKDSKDISISVTNGNVNVAINNSEYKGYSVMDSKLDKSIFKDKTKCPIVYTRTVNKSGAKEIHVSSNQTDFSQTQDSVEKEDNNTGESITVDKYKPDKTPELSELEKFNCGVLGSTDDSDDTAYYLQLALDIIKYVAIASLIGLSSLDFFKAVAQQDNDALKKAVMTVAKRGVYTVILFLFPIILEFVFELLGIYGSGNDIYCGLK